MRALFFIGAIVSAWPWYAGANVRECQSYLIAPKGYKEHTRQLLRGTGAQDDLKKRSEQLLSFVKTAPAGDPKIVAYLLALNRDSVAVDLTPPNDRLTSLSEIWLNTYLVRPGNEALAAPLMEQFLDGFWLHFLYGSDEDSRRYRHDIPWSQWVDQQLTFVLRMSKDSPTETVRAWDRALTKTWLDELIRLQTVTRDFASAETYLRGYLRQSAEEIREDDRLFEEGEDIDDVVTNRERLHYVRDLIAEMDAPISDQDTERMLRFYKIGDPPFGDNRTFARDQEGWRSPDCDIATPAHMLVYLVRLSRRLGLAPAPFVELEATIKRIKELLPKYPRPVGGGYSAAGRI